MPTKEQEVKEVSTVKYGKIEIPMSDGKSPYVPPKSGGFIDHGDIMKTLAIGIRDNMPVLLIGESGTGKTSAIRHLAHQTGSGLRRVNLNGGTTADELVGRLLINEKGTYWVDGILTEAMRNGEWIVLDEINAALPEVLFVLQSVMDDDGYLVLNEKDDKEIVHKHANFRLFATCNPPEYAGTKEMNKALLSRFPICINAEFPSEKVEMEIIENHLGNAVAQSEMAIKLVGMANDTRKGKQQDPPIYDYAINTRDVLNVLKLVENMDPIDALSLAFANKLDVADRNALKAMGRLQLPSTKKKANATRVPVKNTNDIQIGGTYVMDADVNGAYFCVTTKKEEYEAKMAGSIADILVPKGREMSIKGDEFIVEALFWQEGDGQATKTEETENGDKIASAIRIVAGPNKGKLAFIAHHAEIENSADIINNIYEIK